MPAWRPRRGWKWKKVRSALSYLCQVGRAMYDLGSQVYRHRDLFQGAFSAQDAAAAVRAADKPTTPQERAAQKIMDEGNVRIIKASAGDDWIQGQRQRPRHHRPGARPAGAAHRQGGAHHRGVLHLCDVQEIAADKGAMRAHPGPAIGAHEAPGGQQERLEAISKIPLQNLATDEGEFSEDGTLDVSRAGARSES